MAKFKPIKWVCNFCKRQGRTYTQLYESNPPKTCPDCGEATDTWQKVTPKNKTKKKAGK